MLSSVGSAAQSMGEASASLSKSCSLKWGSLNVIAVQKIARQRVLDGPESVSAMQNSLELPNQAPLRDNALKEGFSAAIVSPPCGRRDHREVGGMPRATTYLLSQIHPSPALFSQREERGSGGHDFIGHLSKTDLTRVTSMMIFRTTDEGRVLGLFPHLSLSSPRRRGEQTIWPHLSLTLSSPRRRGEQTIWPHT